MKIILVDNYDREGKDPVLIADHVVEAYATIIYNYPNIQEDMNSENCYRVKSYNYILTKWEP
mgnify:CR=1 FL=1